MMIETETAKIRESWSEAERAKRAGVDLQRWTAPAFVIDASGVAEVAESLV